MVQELEEAGEAGDEDGFSRCNELPLFFCLLAWWRLHRGGRGGEQEVAATPITMRLQRKKLLKQTYKPTKLTPTESCI